MITGALVAAMLTGSGAQSEGWVAPPSVDPAVRLDRRLSVVFGSAAGPVSGLRPRPAPLAIRASADADAPGRIVYSWHFIDGKSAIEGGRQWNCLAQALYHEARGESVKGQFAVAEVILNRVDSHLWPSTVCNVVHQGTGRRLQCQFTFTCDGHSDRVSEHRAWQRAGKIAQIMLKGGARVLTGGATHYHTRAVNPRWARKFPRTAEIGTHLFYRHPRS